MDPADRKLIDDLYRVFATYERTATDGDTKVHFPDADQPLRTLSEADLRSIVRTLPGTSGDLDVFRHYVPRILEILAEGGWAEPFSRFPGSKTEAFLVLDGLDRLRDPPWSQWPGEEPDAIRRFLERFGRKPSPPHDPKDGPWSGGDNCSAWVDGTYVHNIDLAFTRELIEVEEGHPSYEPAKPHRMGPFFLTVIFPSTLPAIAADALYGGEGLTLASGHLAGRSFLPTLLLARLPGDPSRKWMMFIEDLKEPDDERGVSPH